MSRPSRASSDFLSTWLAEHSAWESVTVDGGTGSIARTFRFANYADALAFVVRVSMVAEKRDHHPDVELGWGRAKIALTTHDAGGVTSLDFELAEVIETLLRTTPVIHE